MKENQEKVAAYKELEDITKILPVSVEAIRRYLSNLEKRNDSLEENLRLLVTTGGGYTTCY